MCRGIEKINRPLTEWGEFEDILELYREDGCHGITKFGERCEQISRVCKYFLAGDGGEGS